VIAGRTSRVRLGTNILLAALRRPVTLAISVATLDVLSGGRVDLGVGVGWQREEYEAAGLDFDERGALLDLSLGVCRCLWTDKRASFSSPDLTFDAIHMMPKPLQPGGVPIWVSGTVNPRVVRRLARYGSGWIPWGPAAADLPAGIRAMRAGLEAAGRDPESLQVVGNLKVTTRADGTIDYGPTMEDVARMVDAGVTDVRPNLRLPADAGVDHLAEFVEAFRETVHGTDVEAPAS
jgi:probable F420-dependent oxidoreductase